MSLGNIAKILNKYNVKVCRKYNVPESSVNFTKKVPWYGDPHTKKHKQPRATQNVYDTNYKQNTGTAQMGFHVRLSEVQIKTGAELIYTGIVGPNLARHLLFCSQIPPHHAVRDEFGTSLSMNFGKAHSCH